MKFSWNCLINNIFFNLSPTSSYLHPLSVEICDSNSRLVVDEDDNGKFRLDRVKEDIGDCAVTENECATPGDRLHWLNLYSAGINFSRQNLTSVDVMF